MELEHRVAGLQGHRIEIGDVPCADDEPTRIGIAFDLLDQPGDLVNRSTIGALPGSPLLAVDRTEIAFAIGPFIPDANPVFLQVGNIGIALQKPDQLVDDRAQMQFLGRDQRETLGQIESHLPAEDGMRAGSCAIGFRRAFFQDVPKQFQILLHQLASFGGSSTMRGCKIGARLDITIRTRPRMTKGSDRIWPMVSQPQAR